MRFMRHSNFNLIIGTMTLTKGPSIVLTYEQIERLIDQLTEPEQLKLAEKLSRKLAHKKLLELIDSMRPK